MLGHTIFDLPFLANSMANQNPPYPVANGISIYPYQLSGSSLIMWMDASTIVANDGDPITTWYNHPSCSAVPASSITMSQATAAWKPIYKTNGFGGKPTLAFSSSGYSISGMPSNAFSPFADIDGTMVMIGVITGSGMSTGIFTNASNGIFWFYQTIPGETRFKRAVAQGLLFPDSSQLYSSSFVQPMMIVFAPSSTGIFRWYENQYARGGVSQKIGGVPTQFMYGPFDNPTVSKATASISEVMYWSGSTLTQADITNLFTNYVMKKYPGAGFYQA